MQVSTAAPATANSIPSKARSRPGLPSGIAASSAEVPGSSGPTLIGPNSWAEAARIEIGSSEPRPKAPVEGGRVARGREGGGGGGWGGGGCVFRRPPPLFDAPRRIEVRFIREEHRAEDS